MNSTFRALFSLLLFMALVGCSTSSQMFRNREMDYTTVAVENLQGLETPPGMSAPTVTPALTIPPGQNSYPPGSPPDMTPPGFSEVTSVPVTPIKYQQNSNS